MPQSQYFRSIMDPNDPNYIPPEQLNTDLPPAPLTMPQNPINPSSPAPVSDQSNAEQMKKQALAEYMARWQKGKEEIAPDTEEYQKNTALRGMQAGMEQAANTMSNFIKPGMKFDSSTQRALAQQSDEAKLKNETDRYNRIKQQGEDAFGKIPQLSEDIAALPEARKEHELKGKIMQEQFETLEDTQAKRQADKASSDNMRDPDSEISKTYRELYTKLSKGQKIDDNISAAQLEKILPVMKDTYKIDQERIAKDNERGEALANKQALVETKFQNLQSNQAQNRQQKLDKENVEFNTRYSNIQNNLTKLDDIVNEYGTFEALGPQSGQMDQLIYDIAIDYAKLVDPGSVAREGEVKSAQKYMLPIKGLFVRNSTARGLIDSMKKNIQQKAQNRQAEIPNVLGEGSTKPETQVSTQPGSAPAPTSYNAPVAKQKTYFKAKADDLP